MADFERLTDEQLGDLRVAMSEMMLERDGITGNPTDEAKRCCEATSALNELTAYRRSGLTPDRAAEIGKALVNGAKWHLCDTCAKEFPDCPPSAHITFGNGKGNDNVIACDAWEEAQRAELPNRPLTLDEFKISLPTVAWIELREADSDILAAVFTDEGVYEVQNGLPWEDIYYDFQGFEYGTGFRVWSGLFHGKPTDQERAAAPWEEEKEAAK